MSRMIDADELLEHAYRDRLDSRELIADMIRNAPTIEPDRSLLFRIGEICVDESKGFISAGRAVEKIRELLREERREG